MSTFTEVAFNGVRNDFESERSAYLWLLERMFRIGGNKLESSSLFRCLPQGRRRRYFAISVMELFLRSPHLAEDRNNFERLPNGLYANMNLSARENFKILCWIAELSGIRYGRDWDWKVSGRRNPLVLTVDDL